MIRAVWTMSVFFALAVGFIILMSQGRAQTASRASGPAIASALSADEAINHAILTANAGALRALLAGDWVVVSGFGDLADKDGFIDFIGKSGKRRTMTLSQARVRIYGNTALVTTHLDAAGPFVKEVNGKLVRRCFDVKERQTDVLVWNGGWKSVLLHETIIPPGAKVTNELSGCT